MENIKTNLRMLACFFLLLAQGVIMEASAQTASVRGIVRDEANLPIAGATIEAKNATTNFSGGATSDSSGQFQINNLPAGGPYTFTISSIGYRTETLSDYNLNPGATTSIVVKLFTAATNLEQVVVVGYGTQKRGNVTGSVSTISSEDMKNRVVPNLSQAIQGADPALNLNFGSGSLDGNYKIDIRGVASVNGGTPLILADGIEVNLNQINPNDVESISILKDASSASIYGAKASSGVILITTKKGKNLDGKAKIDYVSRYGVAQNTTSTDFIRTGYDHVNIVNKFYDIYQGVTMLKYNDDEMAMLEARKNDLTENPSRPWTIIGDDNKYYYYGNTDWYNYFYRKTRPQVEQGLSVTGGSNKMDYYLSGRYWSQDGIFNIYKDNFTSYSLFGKLGAQIKKGLKYTGTVSYNASTNKYAGYYDYQQTISSLQSNIISSFIPRNPDGTIVQYTNQLNANSPIGAGHGGFLTADKARNSRGNRYLVLSNQLDLDVTKDLVFTATYAYKVRDRLNRYRNMPFDYSRQVGNILSFTSGTISNYYQEVTTGLNDHNLNIYGTYNKRFTGGHNFKFVAGAQYEDFRQVETNVRKNDLLSDDLSAFSVASGEATVSQIISAFRTLGAFARANYDFKNKYLLEFSGRWDGTSRFAPESRWGFFPSGSIGWRMDREGFWDPLKGFWNGSKLRFSVGSLGNQQVDYYSYISEISASNLMDYTFDGNARANYANVSNPISSNLTWETITTYDLGWDLAFLNNRLSVTADYYVRNTKNMLTPSLTLPLVFGAPTPRANAADLRTKGWELYLNWKDNFDVKSRPFNYNLGFTLGDYISTITKFNNPDKLISDYYEGMRLGEIWGYKVKGLFKTDADAAAYQAKINDIAVNNRVYISKKENELSAGDVEFIDLNGDNIINAGSGTVGNPGDKRIIGNQLPRYSYSMRGGFDWNGFDFSILFQGVGMQDWYPTQNAYDFWGPYSFPSLSFIHTDFLSNSWSPENPNAYFPKPRGYETYSSGSLGVINDRYLQNASYLRLKNLTLGYTYNMSKAIQSIRLYVAGENLHYWSKLKKYSKTVDPEMANSTDTYNSGSGVGYNFSKLYSVGLNITF